MEIVVELPTWTCFGDALRAFRAGEDPRIVIERDVTAVQGLELVTTSDRVVLGWPPAMRTARGGSR